MSASPSHAGIGSSWWVQLVGQNVKAARFHQTVQRNNIEVITHWSKVWSWACRVIGKNPHCGEGTVGGENADAGRNRRFERVPHNCSSWEPRRSLSAGRLKGRVRRGAGLRNCPRRSQNARFWIPMLVASVQDFCPFADCRWTNCQGKL